MSILIKGMDMPKNCWECPFGDLVHPFEAIESGIYCFEERIGENDVNKFMQERGKDCPLVEIPTPHGRLGDLDVLLEESLKEGAYNYVDSWQIAEQPTIIEAEGKR